MKFYLMLPFQEADGKAAHVVLEQRFLLKHGTVCLSIIFAIPFDHSSEAEMMHFSLKYFGFCLHQKLESFAPLKTFTDF